MAGSAWGTVIAQGVMGLGFIIRLWQLSGRDKLPNPKAMRPLLRMSMQIFGRTTALYTSFVVFTAVLAYVGPVSLAAHQVIFQLWLFIALVLDSIAIAGQVMVSRALGGNDREGAIFAARRMIAWSMLIGAAFAVGMLAFSGPLPRVFTAEPDVLERVAAAWPIFALM